MAISLKHNKVVTTPDDGTSEVGSDEWNAEHSLSCADGVVLGRAEGAGGGAVGELPLADLRKRKVTSLSIVSGTATADLAGGANRDFTLALTANTTLALSNLPAAPYVGEIEIEVKQPATGGPYTLTLPASFHPLGASDTAIASAANAVTVLSAKTWDQGSTWRYAMKESE